MMRQIAGSFAQYEKTRLVTKLRRARECIREASGKCEGRKSYAERDPQWFLRQSASIGARPRATEDRSGRLRANWPKGATPTAEEPAIESQAGAAGEGRAGNHWLARVRM